MGSHSEARLRHSAAPCILLPTLNEEPSIGKTVSGIRRISRGYHILVVDGGSSDSTRSIAKKAGAQVLLVRGGKGLAVRKAFRQIRSSCAVLLDADLSYSPSEIPLLLSALRDSDVAAGSRFKGKIAPNAMSLVNRVGNIFLSCLASLLYGARTTDVCCGFWAFSKKAYKKMEIDAQNFELEANLYAQCAKKGLKVADVRITYSRRYLQKTAFVLPWYIKPSTGGAITTMRNAIIAPTRAAVAHTFALALVSAPIIWPAA